MFSWRNKKKQESFSIKKKMFYLQLCFIHIHIYKHLSTMKQNGPLEHTQIRKLTLKLPVTTFYDLLSALSSACDFKFNFCKQCGPISDCSSRSSLIRVHTVCLYAKIGLKSLQEYSADDKQATFSDASFLVILRVKILSSDTCMCFLITS